MTEILRAHPSDLDAIEQIYTRVHDDEEKGLATTGWIRGVYPIRETAEQALKRDDLFVLKAEGKVVATGIINKIQVDVYKDIGWKHSVPDKEVMVLHTLAVDPLEKGIRDTGRPSSPFMKPMPGNGAAGNCGLIPTPSTRGPGPCTGS